LRAASSWLAQVNVYPDKLPLISTARYSHESGLVATSSSAIIGSLDLSLKKPRRRSHFPARNLALALGFLLAVIFHGTATTAGLLNFTGIDPAAIAGNGQTFAWQDGLGNNGSALVRLVTSPNALLAGYPLSNAGNTTRHDGTVLKDAFNGSPASATIVHEYLIQFDHFVDIVVDNAETMDAGEFIRFRTDGTNWTGGIVLNPGGTSLSGIGTREVMMQRVSGSGSYPIGQFSSSRATEVRWFHGTVLGFPNGSGEAFGVNVVRGYEPVPSGVPEPSPLALGFAGLIGLCGYGVRARRRRGESRT